MIDSAPGLAEAGLAEPASNAAWHRYQIELDRIRDSIYNHPFAATAAGRGGAHYLFQQIQAAAFNVSFGPDQRAPRFFANLLFDPGVYTWTSPGADYLYRKAFLDGAGTYRITGQRHSSSMMLVQLMGAYWNDSPSEMKSLGMWDLDQFSSDADGSFEIILDACEHEGNWIQLDRSRKNICVMTREVFDDWENECRSDLWIEPIGPIAAPPVLSEAEYARRLAGMIHFMDYTVGKFSQSLVQDVACRGGINRFVSANLSVNHKHAGANALGGFDMMKFELDGKILLIEIDKIEARQWTMQTSDLWHQSLNFVDHQSSLNGHQAKPDRDGVIRIVLSVDDPGVPNWLDPVGHQTGSIDFRYLMSSSAPAVRCSLVSNNELRSALPASTPIVTSNEREVLLRRRRRAAMKRWGSA